MCGPGTFIVSRCRTFPTKSMSAFSSSHAERVQNRWRKSFARNVNPMRPGVFASRWETALERRMRASILRYPFSGRYVRRTRYSRAVSEVPTDVQGESTTDFTSPCAIRYSLTGQKSSSHVLLCLDEEPALGQDDPLLGG